MKCPRCGYEVEESQASENWNPYDDHFFELPVKMERDDSCSRSERARLFACPKCCSVFIDPRE